MNRIIIQLKGGLGNQMFQYALGRHLAHIHQCDLKLDISVIQLRHNSSWITQRKYELGAFHIQENLCKNTPKNLSSFLKKPLFSKNPTPILEKDFAFDPSVFTLKPPLHLIGYWQSEQYFKPIEPILREEFKPKIPFSEVRQALSTHIENSQSVGVHIRRGDYVSNPISSQFHGVCSLDYYRQAIEHITSKLPEPYFFIFSDEPDWVKANLKLSYPHLFIEDPDCYPAFADMMLLKQCDHQIIANSTYSWWAAWLNENPEKIVIAPQKWFQNPQINTRDLLPESWIKL
ncbi:MAG: alpha-1,2-fucosyltransferase [Microscillaceae bacterium]|nr:alpha-1,2-fucosyltransferase [Microscillaceae bacterium]